MDSIQFGAFVAQLRKEKGLTQRELADLLHVTDKAVSKWETGKGFPDLKLLEPLAQALDVSLVELLQGECSPRESLTVAEAGQLAAQAMEQSQKTTARRYLKLLRWLLTAIALWCGLCLIPAFIILHDTLTVHTIEGIIGGQDGADPASVVYDAVAAAKARNADILICDTAGRLHNKKNLMEELRKIYRILEKEYPEAYLETLVVLDGTTGQNALVQARQFAEVANVTGIILTKLDGTAKGGIAVAIQSELDIPVKYIGVGESIDDLQKFDANSFVDALFDIHPEEN